MANEKKARRLLEQLEEEGTGDIQRTLAIHQNVLMLMTGEGSKVKVPERPVREEPRRATPEGIPSPPSAGEAIPGAKDSRVAKDSRIEDARNVIGGPEEAKKEEKKVRKAIAEDEKLARAHGVAVGADHPEDRGLEGATTDEPEDEDEETDEEEPEEGEEESEESDDESEEEESEERDSSRPTARKRSGRVKKTGRKGR